MCFFLRIIAESVRIVTRDKVARVVSSGVVGVAEGGVVGVGVCVFVG